MEPTHWFEIITLFTVLTILIVYFVPSDSPFFIIRYVFSFVFIAFLPGYCLVNILFTKKNRLDVVENSVLSVALSFGVAGLLGLFLGLSPIGINFTSITYSLTLIVLVLSAIAFIVKRRELKEPQVQSTGM
ncbi:MAG: DUF1616 domain-containing protein [Candidatus Bathyarchaeota archaeon]|nr:DUF1616 domain-containing protein [Candidatus Bathyarchaeota archaeon]